MTHRERFIKTLKCEPIGGQVPTFENAPAEAGAIKESHHRVFEKVFDIAAKHTG